MLWYKVWLETRARFLISLGGITALCVYRVYEGLRAAPAWTLMGLNYYYLVLRNGQGLLQLAWLVAVTLLMMGGLLQEKANGSAPFTLSMPVSRTRLMNVRISAGLIEAALLIAVPWAAMYAMFCFTGPARAIAQVLFYVVVMAGGGAVFAGTSLLISSLVEGAYTAPTISAGIVLLCANVPRSLAFMNPMAFMGGQEYLGPGNLATGPMPWGHVAAYMGIAALLIAASVKAVERRNF
jgi:ABC-2 type transport system permease protein